MVSPAVVAERVATACLRRNATFFPADEYGAALLQLALWEANAAFPGDTMDFSAAQSYFLDKFATRPGTAAYDVLHNASFEFGYSIGDTKGLFPLSYLERAVFFRDSCCYQEHRAGRAGSREDSRDNDSANRGDLALSGSSACSCSNSSLVQYDNATDIAIAEGGARAFVLAWPWRLPDGTIARRVGNDVWPPTLKEATYLWGDDQFMGLALLARLAAALPGQGGGGGEWEAGLHWAGSQLLNFSAYLRDPEDGLYAHAFRYTHSREEQPPAQGSANRNTATAAGDPGTTTMTPGAGPSGGSRSCCKWARANGWGLMAKAEVLRAYDAVAARGPGRVDEAQRAAVLALFQQHAEAFVRAQHPTDGRWHQVLNESATYLETSATAMATFALATGLRHGWLLPPNQTSSKPGSHARTAVDFNATVRAAWAALASTVGADGTVDGICIATGIQRDAAAYNARPTYYELSLNGGIGAVVRAATAVHLLGID